MPDGPDPYRFAGRAELEQLLSGAGLAGARADALCFDSRWTAPTSCGRGYWAEACARPPGSRPSPRASGERMRADLERLCAEHRQGERLSVPVAVTLGAASRSPA